MWELHERNVATMPPPKENNDNLRRVYSYAECQPIFTIKSASAQLGLSYNSVASHVGRLCDLGILEETTNAARNRIFAYADYIAILKEGIE